MCFPEIVIKMIQYLVGFVLRGLISVISVSRLISVYSFNYQLRMTYQPLFEATVLLPFILSRINWSLDRQMVHDFTRKVPLHSLENNAKKYSKRVYK